MVYAGGIDPYVLIQYKGQERKSSIARGKQYVMHVFFLYSYAVSFALSLTSQLPIFF